MEFKVGEKVVITDVTKIDNADGFESNKPYKVTAVHHESPVISNGEVELDFYDHELQYIQPYKSKKQRITALENEVAELKLIVEGLRSTPKTMRDTLDEVFAEPSTDDEVQAQDEIIKFEGAQYRKVDREAREGDVVIFKDTTSPYLTNGKPYLAEILDINTCVGNYQLAVASSKNINCSVYDNYYKRTSETVDVYELIRQEKSPNQLRAEIIEKAKKFVEETVAYGRSSNRYKYEGNSTYRSNFYDVDFFVKGNKVTAVIYWLRGNVTRVEKPEHVGRAKCAPGDVFNEHIGKAIALGRALGLDVSEFEQAVQPTIAVGQVITHKKGSMPMYTVITLDKVNKNLTYVSDEGENRNAVGGDLPNETWYTIINDTNAIYEGVK